MTFYIKKFAPVFFLTLILFKSYAAKDNISVMLRVVSEKQDLSRGYNFVEQLTKVVYDEVMAGHTHLWDSPSKEIKITAAALKDIEQSAATSFISLNYLFIYEKWTKAETEIQTTTLGFSFIGKNAAGDIAFGYLDYADISQALLAHRLMVNADGNCAASISYSLQTKQFDFSIVQFNGEAIPGETESEKIKKDYISGMNFNSVLFPQQLQAKCITYILEKPLDLEDVSAQLTSCIINAVQGYLAERPVSFSDWGGDEIKGLKYPEELNVTQIAVTENWNKYAGKITTTLKNVIIYVNGQPLNALTADDLKETDINCHSKNIVELLKEKNMLYYISRVNDQQIERINTFNFLKALHETDWNQLNYYVEHKQ